MVSFIIFFFIFSFLFFFLVTIECRQRWRAWGGTRRILPMAFLASEKALGGMIHLYRVSQLYNFFLCRRYFIVRKKLWLETYTRKVTIKYYGRYFIGIQSVERKCVEKANRHTLYKLGRTWYCLLHFLFFFFGDSCCIM